MGVDNHGVGAFDGLIDRAEALRHGSTGVGGAVGHRDHDDVPFVAVALFAEGEGESQCLTLRTNIDESVTVDADHPIRVSEDPQTGHPVPYVLVREAGEARIARPVYYELVALGLERGDGSDHLYGVWSSGEFFPLGRLPAELA